MNRTLVIAEPGCTHEGDKAVLVKLLETAHACGADCFKPQWTSDPIAMCERRHIGPDHPKRAFYEQAYGWLAFPVEWHQEFRDRCRALGLQYACSAYLPQDVATLAQFVDYFKISSFEQDENELIAALQHGVDVLVSTGNREENDPPCVADPAWPNYERAKYLHCVSAYPAPKEELNLAVLGSMLFQGYSDHARHPLSGMVAISVLAGAGMSQPWFIETHYRLDDCDPQNPDYAVAFTPAEFAQYIQNIRDAEIMLGDGVKRQQPCEAWAVPYRVVS